MLWRMVDLVSVFCLLLMFCLFLLIFIIFALDYGFQPIQSSTDDFGKSSFGISLDERNVSDHMTNTSNFKANLTWMGWFLFMYVSVKHCVTIFLIVIVILFLIVILLRKLFLVHGWFNHLCAVLILMVCWLIYRRLKLMCTIY